MRSPSAAKLTVRRSSAWGWPRPRWAGRSQLQALRAQLRGHL